MAGQWRNDIGAHARRFGNRYRPNNRGDRHIAGGIGRFAGRCAKRPLSIAFGRIVGSNIYNIGAILRIVAPAPIPPVMVLRDWIAMVGAALLRLMFSFTGRKVTRLEGVVLTAQDGVSCWFLLSAAPAAG